MRKLILIDGNAILHRAFHALPPLTSKSGEPINAVYGFVSMLLRIITDLKPTHIAVAFDRKEPTFRHVVFEKYQSQRPIMHEDLSSQFEKTKEVLLTMGISAYSEAGYEADDVIGTIAKQATKHNIEEVIVVTGDRDILQLVTNKVKVYLPIKGLSESKLMGIDEVKEKIGVTPDLIPDYKALVGDPSDNYPGVPGIGPKTAVNLLREYKSVNDIYKNLKHIPEPLRMKLQKGRDSALMSHKLATIVTSISLKIDFDNLANWKIYNPEIESVFSKIGFKTLKERVKKVSHEVEERKVKENQKSLF